MRLKTLKIHGFKSFADDVEMTFEDGITGVVGPNGCGKSNIADAVRWVLGEQSAKTLRGTRMEDVIFNGTEKRRRLAFCEVSLVFDNTDHSLPLDFAEVQVTRRVYRSGEGEYSINGTACRLKDIVDLFRDTGIGKDGYSLIGQGRIDEILSQKSEDRRQIFEEAAGIVKYKTRKLEAERRMENTRVNLERVEDILSELESRVEPLKAQSETAREYLQLRDELKTLELNAFLSKTERYNDRIQDLHKTEEELRAALDESSERLEELLQKRSDVQLLLDRAEVDAAEKRDIVQGRIQDVEAREGAVSVLKERIVSLNRDLARLQADKDSAENGGVGIAERTAALAQEIESERQSLRIEQGELQTMEQELAAKDAALAKTEEQVEQAKQDIINAMNRLGDVRSREGRLQAMQSALKQQIESLSGELSRGDDGDQSLSDEIDALSSRLVAEEKEKSEIEAAVRASDAEVRALGEAEQKAQAERQRLNADRQRHDSRVRLLTEMQRDYEGYQNSVKQVLLRSRQLERAGGVHGVVADLIHVPESLEKAIDMVLGGSLQHVVVDRDEDAKRMIEYLRSGRFGRATFLPISSVRGRTLNPQERKLLVMPGCVGLASELIEFDSRYQGVVDSLLGRTVVAENLDAGIQIQRAGRYAFRLVTLEGDVMHSGGSMTGGSVQSRATSLLSRGREIDEGRRAIESIDLKLERLNTELAALSEKREQAKRLRQGHWDDLHAEEILVARTEAQRKAFEDERAAHQERMENTRREKERLEAQLQDVLQNLDSISGEQTDARESTADLQAAVRTMQEELYAHREEADRLRTEITDRRVTLASRQRGLEANEKEHHRLTEQAGDLEALLQKSVKALGETSAELSKNREELKIGEEALQASKKSLQEVREAFRIADERRTSAQRELQALTGSADELRQQGEALRERHHRAELQISRVEAEYKQVSDRIFEEYELTYAAAEPFRVPDFKLPEADRRIQQIRQRIREMGTVNVASVDEYRQTAQRVEELSSQRDDLLKAQADLQGIVEELERKMETQFREQFQVMNNNFQRTFVNLFGGGKAELRLSDAKDALNCGIDIVAQPPGKKLQMLSLLSGGERALTAIAILFAMLDLKPTPFCILDEIEAALDDANIDNYADFLKQYSKNTQFVVITHRKGTMERCDSLYGVVMEEKGVSKMVSVLLNEAS